MATKQIDLKKLLEEKTAGIEPAGNAKEIIDTADKKIPKNLMFDAEATEFKPETVSIESMTLRALTVEEAKIRNSEMLRFIDEVLIPGVDYGIIPHASKPSLLKPGAEKVLSFLGYAVRTEIVHRVEDYKEGFFSYEFKAYAIDASGVCRGEGVGVANSKEAKFIKNSGFAVQNTLLKIGKKRSLCDLALLVGSLSGVMSQDLEDLNLEPDRPVSTGTTEAKEESFGNPPAAGKGGKGSKTASVKQIKLLESLMEKHGSSVAAMNKYTREHYAVDDYHDLSPAQCSSLIDKFMSLG